MFRLSSECLSIDGHNDLTQLQDGASSGSGFTANSWMSSYCRTFGSSKVSYRHEMNKFRLLEDVLSLNDVPRKVCAPVLIVSTGA
jgi:hypothetical protein